MVVDVRPLFPWLAALCFGAVVFAVGKYLQIQERKRRDERKLLKEAANAVQDVKAVAAAAGMTHQASAAPAYGQSQTSQTPDPGRPFGFAGGTQQGK